MFKIAWVSAAPPQTPLGSLRRSLRPPSCEGLLDFGNRWFAPSALNPPLAPKHKILKPPLRYVLLIIKCYFQVKINCLFHPQLCTEHFLYNHTMEIHVKLLFVS